MRLGMCPGCNRWRIVVAPPQRTPRRRFVLRRHEPCGRMHVTAETPLRDLPGMRRTGLGA